VWPLVSIAVETGIMDGLRQCRSPLGDTLGDDYVADVTSTLARQVMTQLSDIFMFDDGRD
jgi:hypothetical protein